MAALLLFFLYCMIFSFSDQNGEQSGGLSYRISEYCVEIVNALLGGHWTQGVTADSVAYWEHPIRKLAHLLEYACMGVLVYTMWRPWRDRGHRLYLLVIVWVFTSAAGDELHQRFIPGRYGSFWDVLLDTAGGVCGVLFCVMLERIGMKLYRRRIERKTKRKAKMQ